jgi:hypothetical protein
MNAQSEALCASCNHDLLSIAREAWLMQPREVARAPMLDLSRVLEEKDCWRVELADDAGVFVTFEFVKGIDGEPTRIIYMRPRRDAYATARI